MNIAPNICTHYNEGSQQSAPGDGQVPGADQEEKTSPMDIDDTSPVNPLNYKSVPLPLGRQVMPLEDFEDWRAFEIAEAALASRPPERWLNFGFCMMESRAWYEWHWHRGIDPEKRREPIQGWQRQAIIDRDGLVCRLCGLVVLEHDVHIDHILPVALGGRNNPDNLQVSHSLCNARKGARV